MAPVRSRLTLKNKIDIIKCYDAKKQSVRELATQFKVGKTQIGTILKSRVDLLRKWCNENVNGETKKNFIEGKGFEIDHVCYEWFCRVRAKNLPISGPLIQQKAIEIAKTLGRTNFKASNGWLEKFRKRHNIAYKAICGESSSVDHDIVDDWNNKLIEICEGFVPKNIFNLDETGLFFRALPNKTMCLKGENCSGGKISKERITVMLCVNMEDDFETPLVIGKALKPRCFKNIIVNDLGVTWKANRKAWMTQELMKEWLSNFDRKMQGRKVILFLDNATSHPHLNLQNVKFAFFPPNVTSTCQPLDLGMIKNFKTHYRINLLKYVISSKDNENIKKPNVTVLEAVMWTTAALKKINKETVTKCFIKAGFPGSDNIGKLTQVEDLSNELTKQVSTIYPTNAQDYSSIDECLQTEDLSLNIEDIINDGMSEDESHDVEQEEDSTDGVDEEKITLREALQLANKLKTFCVNKSDAISLSLVNQLQSNFEAIAIQENKQTKISDFFFQ
ncbi:unnamed protein product [Macrosiphum euphorbiae]|uniref:HTH CENPB-type domain-containing protein n=1 Tax=Macrosiphum euphorbiae TaxID=13131 RepID=A0AAV0Y0E1_9HEMI|nr:unnamed protein product [Macrosiphum euphorbiae]